MAMTEGRYHGYGRGYVSWLWQMVCVMAMAAEGIVGYGYNYYSLVFCYSTTTHCSSCNLVFATGMSGFPSHSARHTSFD